MRIQAIKPTPRLAAQFERRRPTPNPRQPEPAPYGSPPPLPALTLHTKYVETPDGGMFVDFYA